MPDKRKSGVELFFINFALFALLLLLHTVGDSVIKIAGATPILTLSALIAFSMFASEWTSSFTGLVLGIFADSVSANGSLFNTVCYLLIALFVSVILHFLFNNNLRSSIAVGLIGSVFFFTLKWLIFFALSPNVQNSLPYLLYTALPSALYTAIAVVPFYYLERYLFKKYS